MMSRVHKGAPEMLPYLLSYSSICVWFCKRQHQILLDRLMDYEVGAGVFPWILLTDHDVWQMYFPWIKGLLTSKKTGWSGWVTFGFTYNGRKPLGWLLWLLSISCKYKCLGLSHCYQVCWQYKDNGRNRSWGRCSLYRMGKHFAQSMWHYPFGRKNRKAEYYLKDETWNVL